MHINYFGDVVLFTGFAILTHNFFILLIPLLIILNFVLFYIPAMDRYLNSKYGEEFREYAKNTKKLIPLVY
jgi:protein-S-isoprenylcysteine O-methyltransferase Ste14